MMKKTIYLLAFTTLLIFSCSNKDSKEKQEMLKKEAVEIHYNNSLSNEMETMKTDIESSVAEVDSLIKDL
jgi:PBP1b-binding outer membrane lipoprotein LpoB